MAAVAMTAMAISALVATTLAATPREQVVAARQHRHAWKLHPLAFALPSCPPASSRPFCSGDWHPFCHRHPSCRPPRHASCALPVSALALQPRHHHEPAPAPPGLPRSRRCPPPYRRQRCRRRCSSILAIPLAPPRPSSSSVAAAWSWCAWQAGPPVLLPPSWPLPSASPCLLKRRRAEAD